MASDRVIIIFLVKIVAIFFTAAEGWVEKKLYQKGERWSKKGRRGSLWYLSRPSPPNVPSYSKPNVAVLINNRELATLNFSQNKTPMLQVSKKKDYNFMRISLRRPNTARWGE